MIIHFTKILSNYSSTLICIMIKFNSNNSYSQMNQDIYKQTQKLTLVQR